MAVIMAKALSAHKSVKGVKEAQLSHNKTTFSPSHGAKLLFFSEKEKNSRRL